MKKRVVFIVILFLLIIFALVGYLLLKNNQLSSSADTVTTESDLTYVKARSLVKKACTGRNWDLCQVDHDLKMPVSIIKQVSVITLSHLQKNFRTRCINQFITTTKSRTTSTVQPIKGCQIVFQPLSKNSYRAVITNEVKKYNPPSKFESIYVDEQNNNNTSEDMGFNIDAQLISTRKLTFTNNKWRITYIDNQNKDFDNFNGSVGLKYTVNLNGSTDLPFEDYSSQGLTIDESKSYWTIETSGKMFGTYAGNWQAQNEADLTNIDKYQISELTFCPGDLGCEIKISEKLKIVGQVNTLDPSIGKYVSGDVNTYQAHSEVYRGVGEGDLKTGALRWVKLWLDKFDARDWSRDLAYSQKTTSAQTPDQPKVSSQNEYVHYDGYNESKSTENGLEENKYEVNTTAKRNLLVKDSNQTEIIKVTSSKSEKNQDGNIVSRSGNGEIFENNTLQKGAYTPKSSLLELTTGQLVELFSGGREQYTNSYLSEPIRVPKKFSATDYQSRTSYIGTETVKVVPKKLVVVWYTNVLSNKDLLYIGINKIADELRSKKATVYFEIPKNKKEFLDLLSGKKKDNKGNKIVSDNTWVILFGHGSSQSFYLGAAGFGQVNFSEIKDSLSQNQIKFDGVFLATDSCYGGRLEEILQPLGISVLGSLGVTWGAADIASGGFGTTIGYGGSAWSLSESDILQQIQTLLNNCSS